MYNYDITSLHENEIRKNFDKIDSIISNIRISEESQKKNLINQLAKFIFIRLKFFLKFCYFR